VGRLATSAMRATSAWPAPQALRAELAPRADPRPGGAAVLGLSETPAASRAVGPKPDEVALALS